MKCPNCLFELQPSVEQCPFCSFVIPAPAPSADDPVVVDEQGRAVPIPGAPPIPDPQAEAAVPSQPTPDPEAMVLEGDLRPSEEPPPSVEGAAAPSTGGKGGVLKLALIAGGAFLALKLGLLDNLLGAVGLKSAPPAPESTAAAAPAEPAPAEPAAAAPEQPLAPPEPVYSEPAPQEEAPPPKPSEWTFEGRVYDVLGFRPVKGAVMLFMSQGEDETFEARSDARGSYRITLPARAGGYKLICDHPEFIGLWFDEPEGGFKAWPLARRGQLRAGKPVHAPWAADGTAPVTRNVVLFPDITDR